MNADMLTRQIANADAYAPEFDLPEAARPADVAFADISRRIDMDAKEMTRAVEADPRNRWSGWMAAAAAFGLVVLLAGGVMLLNGSNSEVPPATTPTNPAPPTTQASEPTSTVATTTTTQAVEQVTAAELEIIAAYEAAVNSGDEQQISEVLAADFRQTTQGEGDFFRAADTWIRQQLFETLEGSSVTYTECVRKEAAVSCTETWTGPRQIAIMWRDWTAQVDFFFAEGVVVSMHTRHMTFPGIPTIGETTDNMVRWAAEQVDAETLAGLEKCGDPALYYDVTQPGLCGEWFQKWIDAGRP